mmetsp:Transcript_4501/g.6871  ORF Transcript_4501/g.6871 Transcript_4501/m.6871 type:complete len:93 (+) Transcript_4501:462-740(+)
MRSHWFAEARAHKFDRLASDRCRCCTMDVAEMTDHIFQCPSREPIHSKFFTKFVELMREKKIPIDILELFEVGLGHLCAFHLMKHPWMPRTL